MSVKVLPPMTNPSALAASMSYRGGGGGGRREPIIQPSVTMDMARWQELDANVKLQREKIAADKEINKYTADQNLAGTKYSSDKNAEAMTKAEEIRKAATLGLPQAQMDAAISGDAAMRKQRTAAQLSPEEQEAAGFNTPNPDYTLARRLVSQRNMVETARAATQLKNLNNHLTYGNAARYKRTEDTVMQGLGLKQKTSENTIKGGLQKLRDFFVDDDGVSDYISDPANLVKSPAGSVTGLGKRFMNDAEFASLLNTDITEGSDLPPEMVAKLSGVYGANVAHRAAVGTLFQGTALAGLQGAAAANGAIKTIGQLGAHKFMLDQNVNKSLSNLANGLTNYAAQMDHTVNAVKGIREEYPAKWNTPGEPTADILEKTVFGDNIDDVKSLAGISFDGLDPGAKEATSYKAYNGWLQSRAMLGVLDDELSKLKLQKQADEGRGYTAYSKLYDELSKVRTSWGSLSDKLHARSVPWMQSTGGLMANSDMVNKSAAAQQVRPSAEGESPLLSDPVQAMMQAMLAGTGDAGRAEVLMPLAAAGHSVNAALLEPLDGMGDSDMAQRVMRMMTNSNPNDPKQKLVEDGPNQKELVDSMSMWLSGIEDPETWAKEVDGVLGSIDKTRLQAQADRQKRIAETKKMMRIPAPAQGGPEQQQTPGRAPMNKPQKDPKNG